LKHGVQVAVAMVRVNAIDAITIKAPAADIMQQEI
jgi:hypothetical protein